MFKSIFKGNCSFLLLMLLNLCFLSSSYSQTTTQTLTSSGSFVVPCGVTTLTVQCWGAGGGGGYGGGSNKQGGGGGGGGGYVYSSVAVTSGATYNYTIGAGGNGGTSSTAATLGGSSIFIIGATTLTGSGGGLGGSFASGGSGGSGGNGTGGTSNNNGGSGGTGNSTGSGGGGEGAPVTGSAGNGTIPTGGTGTTGGDGGDGTIANGAAGSNGNAVGGGGGGGTRNSNGGTGASGQIIISYATPSTANAGADQILCNTTSFAMSANLPSGFTGAWSCVTNCTGISFSNSSSATSNVNGVPANTAVTVRWTLTHTSGCTLTDNAIVTNSTSCPPINDNCATATAFPAIPTNGTCANLTNQSTAAASNSGVTPTGACSSNSGTPDDDVWFSFVATSTTQILSATWVSGNTDVYWQVFSGACGATMTSLLCTDTNTGGTLTGLTIGQTYYVRLYTWSGTGSTVQDICISSPPPPPSNDNCSGATAFPAIPTDGTCATLNNQSTASATNSGVTPSGACTSNSGTPDEDVWFSFVATSTTQILSATWVSGNSDVYWQIFSGACGATMTSLLCTDTNAGGTVSGLTVGQTYYVRLYSWSSSGSTTQNICISSPPPPPSNDNPCNATPATVNAVYSCTAQTGGTIAGATSSTVGLGACFGTADDDVWYSFVANNSTQYISLTNVAGSTTDLYHSVYAGSCGSPGAALVCSDPNNSTLTGLTVGNTYYVRVYSYTSTSGQTTTFSLCINPPALPPANDNPCNATSVPVNSAAGTCTTQTAGTIMAATASGVSTGTCSGTADDDVWFSFVANGTSMNININNVSGSTTDLYHSVYSGSCGSPGTALICSDPNNSTINGLTIGNTYFIRIYSYTSTSGQTTTFSLCINPTPPPPTNVTCAQMQPICSGSPIVFQAQSGGGSAAPGPDYGCLSTTPNPTWFYLEIATPGSMAIDLTAGSDVDFAMWGPYSSLASAQADCSSYPAPIDCSYSGSNTELMDIASVNAGEVYAVLVTNYANVIQNITLNQSSGATAATNCAILTLPVGLLYFHAIPDDETVNLEWETSSEQNNDYFEIERSQDAINWQAITRKSAQGNSSTNVGYSHTDDAPFKSLSYYRLKQVDYDKSFTYSNIVSVDLSKEAETINNVRPNPANDIVAFDITTKSKGNITIELVNFAGETVYKEIKLAEYGFNTNKLSMSNYQKGVYLLKVEIENSGKTLIQKIIKN